MISVPIDLQTVKSRIKCSDYDSIDEFLADMDLIFTNCIKYNKRVAKLGKIASGLKRWFEKRCSDLGLKDLNLSSSGPESKDGKGSGTSRRRSNRLKC